MQSKTNLLKKAKQVLNAGETPDKVVAEIKNTEKKEKIKKRKQKV